MNSMRWLAIAVLSQLAAIALPVTAQANWLTHILREGGEAGGKIGSKAAKHGIGALDGAAAYVAKFPATANSIPIAAHASAEGHWTFVSRTGETFTAATAEEMSRLTKVLAPGAAQDSKLMLFLSEDTVFREANQLKHLPADAQLHVMAGDKAFPLMRRTVDTGERLFAEVRPNIVVEANAQAMFDEALARLARPLNRSNMRVLALEPGNMNKLSSVPNFDPATKSALVDAVDPGAFAGSLGKLRGQTVMLVGRVEGDALHFVPSSGAAGQLAVSDLARAAEAADINLVILQSAAGRQPGGRNWLWQKVEVAGLDEALNRATFADFLSAVGAGRGELAVAAEHSAPGRIMLTALPSGQTVAPLTDQVGGWLSEFANHAIGNVVLNGVQAFTRDKAGEEEFELRIIPGIPFWVQFTYLAGLILGLLSFGESTPWLDRIWPKEQRDDYERPAGYWLARSVRGLFWLLVFLPVIGIPAFIWAFLQNLWYQLKAPVRWVRWLRGKLSTEV